MQRLRSIAHRLRPAPILTWAAGILSCVFLGHVLFSALSALSNLNFLFSDYGVYTNTLWNLAHGNGFDFLVDHSYLKTHLSFSLLALAPLFHLFDTPLLLIFVQWGFLAAGALILLRAMHRLGTPPALAAALVLWLVAHPYTQSVLLSEFHGVSAYLLLVPWLVYALAFRPGAAWIPFILILGLREDAGFYLPVLCTWMAFSTGRRTGYVMAILAPAYALLAVFVLYPALSGVSLFDVRSPELSGDWSLQALGIRGEATAWLLLPLLPLLWLHPRGWRPLLAFAGLPWLLTMLSGYPRQYGMTFHYPAISMAALAGGALFLLRDAPADAVRRRATGAAALVIVLTLLAHAALGFFLFGGRWNSVYTQPDHRGVALSRMARHMPDEGLLLANHWLAVFGANREDVVTWRYWKREEHAPDYVLCSVDELHKPEAKFLRIGLAAGAWGVRASVFPYVLLGHGHKYGNAEPLLEKLTHRCLPVSSMPGHVDHNRLVPGQGLVRYWPGDRARYPVTLAHSRQRRLEAGTWQVVFTYRTTPSSAEDHAEPGWFSLHQPGEQEALLHEPVRIPAASAADEFHCQTLTVRMPEHGWIEPRVTGGRLPLWIRCVDFIRHPTDPAPAGSAAPLRSAANAGRG